MYACHSSFPHATREDVVREARSWIGTPYHHMGDIKGVGVDCAMILVRIFCGLGLAPPIEPRPYKAQWFLHRDEETIYLNWLRKYGHQVEVAQPGDIQLYNFGRQAAHGAIVVSATSMVHAYMPAKKVIEDDCRALADRYHSSWSAFP